MLERVCDVKQITERKYCSDFQLNFSFPRVKKYQEQPAKGVLWKRCSDNMQQIYRKTSILKCDFNKVAS